MMTPEEMLKLARMRAMLRLIRSDENNGASDDNAYHARYGNRDPMSDKDMINYVPKDEKFITRKESLNIIPRRAPPRFSKRRGKRYLGCLE